MKELHKAYSNINILIVIGYPHIISATIAKKKIIRLRSLLTNFVISCFKIHGQMPFRMKADGY